MRRRVGRAHSGGDREDQPAQAALVANPQHPGYVRVACVSLVNLATAFVEFDEQGLERTTALSRNNRDSTLLHRVRVLVKNKAKTQPSDDKGDPIDAATI